MNNEDKMELTKVYLNSKNYGIQTNCISDFCKFTVIPTKTMFKVRMGKSEGGIRTNLVKTRKTYVHFYLQHASSAE